LRAAVGTVSIAGATALGNALLPARVSAQPISPAITATDLGELRLLQGAGCNVLAMGGEDGALMVDGGITANAEALLQAVYAATGNDRIHTLINTHWHPEQTGANELVGRAGGAIFAHEKTAMYLRNRVSSALFDGRRDPLPEAARPTATTRGEGSLEFPRKKVDYGYLPAAHTDGDLFVHFPDSNVLAAAESFRRKRGRSSTIATAPGLAGACARSSGSQTWSTPTRKSCLRMGGCLRAATSFVTATSIGSFS
jgi:hypothetical protein